MNILFQASFPIIANEGGVQRVTETLARKFLKDGHKVFYLAINHESKEGKINKIKQYFLPNCTEIVSSENVEYYQNLIEANNVEIIINQSGAFLPALKLIQKSNIHNASIISVHHNCISCLIENYRSIIKGNKPNSFFVKKMNYDFVWKLLKLYNRVKYGFYFRKAFNISDRIVLLSNNFIPELKNYMYKIPLQKVVAISNPAPFEIKYNIEEKKQNRLLYVGRLNFHQKRSDLIIEIWKMIYKEFPNWHFDVLGDGKVRKEMELKVKAEGLERIYFHGFQAPHVFLEKAKFFCMTSSFEGYGMVLVEAQAYGVVPFAFDCYSALSEVIVDGETGKIVEKFNIREYVYHLKRLMSDEILRRKMSLKGQKSIKKFHVEKISQSWYELFNQLRNSD